jgi:lipopolysaccharide export LptBFGC system permease protein LptF
MRLILHRYLLKEFFRIFIPSIVAFEFLLILGLTLQSLYKGLDVMSIFVELVPYFIFYALPYALPAALLAATVTTYGRLSGDNELWAMLTSGVHLKTVVFPAAIVGLAFSLFAMVLNAEVLPRSYQMMKIVKEKAARKIVQHLKTTGGKVKLDPYYISIQGIEGAVFRDIAILKAEAGHISTVILAEEGRLEVEANENLIMCALRQGQFVNLSSSKPDTIPTVVPFGDTTFLMPLGLKEYTTLKYMPLSKLLSAKKKIKREIRKSKDLKHEIKVGRRALQKRFQQAQGLYNGLQEQRATASAQIAKANEAISEQERRRENIKNEIKVSENYIRIAEDTLKELRISREIAGIKAGGTADTEIKVSEINSTIEKEKLRIVEAQEEMRIIEEAVEKGKASIAAANNTLEQTKNKEEETKGKCLAAERLLNASENKEKSRDITIAIHRRLSPSFASLAFVLIGIPIGIMSRMGNIIVGFFISFGILLVVYYPLLIWGDVLASDSGFPIAPSMWGANIVISVIAAALLFKIFRK